MSKQYKRKACKPRGDVIRVLRVYQYAGGIDWGYGGRVLVHEQCEHEARGCPHLLQCPLRED